MTPCQREIRRRLCVLAHAQTTRNVSKTCRFYGISRDTFYAWRKAHRAGGEAALEPRKRGPKGPLPHQYTPELIARISRLRTEFSFGAQRIVWYLERYEGLRVSVSGVASMAKWNGPTGRMRSSSTSS